MEPTPKGEFERIIYLVRHGEFITSMSDDPQEESGLPLSISGIARLKREAQVLAKWHLPVDTLISSPFVRAKQTSEILSDALNLPVLEEPFLARTQFGIAQLELILAKYPAARHNLLIGHEPDLSSVIAATTGGTVQIERGGLAKIRLISQKPLRGELLWLLAPQALDANEFELV